MLALASSVEAAILALSPALACEEGDDPVNPNATDIAGIVGVPSLIELYKQDVDEALDEGPFAGSYKTEFFNDPDDPEDATITYVGGPVADAQYLLVKDGDNDPSWYIFCLDDFGWNGTDTIELTGFWPDQGAISHVALYGASDTAVPEPTSIIAWLVCTSGLGLVVRGRMKKGAA